MGWLGPGEKYQEVSIAHSAVKKGRTNCPPFGLFERKMRIWSAAIARCYSATDSHKGCSSERRCSLIRAFSNASSIRSHRRPFGSDIYGNLQSVSNHSPAEQRKSILTTECPRGTSGYATDTLPASEHRRVRSARTRRIVDHHLFGMHHRLGRDRTISRKHQYTLVPRTFMARNSPDYECPARNHAR